MKKKTVKNIIIFIAVAAVAILIMTSLTRLFEPKYMGTVKEGALISEYYDENKDFDILFVGDCEVYENFVPLVLWEEQGYNSYIRGSAQQLIWQSYYLTEETFKYEKPKVVVFNVLSMKYDEPQKEAYNRMTLDGMKWSSSKVNSIKASMFESESFVEYVFPILRYHSRWSELESEDFEYFFGNEKVGDNGYYMQLGVKPVDYIPDPKILGDYNFGENAWFYLDKMRDLCAENGAELVLIKAPSLYPEWYDEWDTQIEDYASENNLKYINFLDYTDEIGLDFSEDTYDAGLHLNLSGAEKLTSFFGEYLEENCDIPDRRAEEELSKEWEDKKVIFEQHKKEREEK